MKQYATTLILWASLLVNEAHTLFSNTRMVKVTGGQIPERWYVWLASDSLFTIMLLTAFVLYQPNKVNIAAVRAFICFAVCDLVMFFINFRQHDYEAIYTILFISVFFFYGQYDKLMIMIKKFIHGTKERKGNTYPAER